MLEIGMWKTSRPKLETGKDKERLTKLSMLDHRWYDLVLDYAD